MRAGEPELITPRPIYNYKGAGPALGTKSISRDVIMIWPILINRTTATVYNWVSHYKIKIIMDNNIILRYLESMS